MITTNDKELLELAAKAAGIEYAYGSEEGCAILDAGGNWTHFWNPLTDDGDALRLAVKTKITLSVTFQGVDARVTKPDGHGYLALEYCKDHGGDTMATTRRAVVRAAALLGKDMP